MRPSPIELRDLAYFVAIVRHGRLGLAARALGVAQPTLSHAVQRLEQALGQALWDRRGSKRQARQLTPAGELVLTRAQRALAEVNAVAQDLDSLRGLASGHLHIGCIPSLMASLLPGVLARFHAAHPGIRLTVSTVRSDDAHRQLDQDGLDAVLVAGAATHAVGPQSIACGHQHFVVVLRRDHPLASQPLLPLASLQEHALLLVPACTYTGGLIERCCQEAGFTPQPAIVLDSPEGLRELVRQGCGLSILPEGYVPAHDPDLCCLHLATPRPRRPIVLLHHGQLADRPALYRFRRILAQAAV